MLLGLCLGAASSGAEEHGCLGEALKILPHPRWNTGREASEINRPRENSARATRSVLAGGAFFLRVCVCVCGSSLSSQIWERKSARALAFQPFFQPFESRMPFAPRREPPRVQISEK